MSATDDLAAFFFVHTATVSPYLGGGRYGDRWDTPRDLPCWRVDDKIVTTQADGTEVTSDGTRVTFGLDHAAELAPGSRVQFPDWPAPARVAQRKVNDPGSLDLPGHVKVVLT